MPGGGRSRGPKRKINWDVEYPSFPGESPPQSRRAAPRTVGTASFLSEAWLRCEEGFQDTSGTLSLAAEKKPVTEERLELFPSPEEAETSTSESPGGVTDITWSSSRSDQSDGDKLQCVDWESDSDRDDTVELNEFEDSESAAEIADSASSASSPCLTGEEGVWEHPKTSSAEILEYSSDSENRDDLENVLFIDSEPSHKYHVGPGPDGRLAVERLTNPREKSAANTVYTPQKKTKLLRTPESSAKKQQLLRGGLAERLQGLQNRERSAISLWRHQCASYEKTHSGSQSGVLTVKILELHEECTVHIATCEQLEAPQAGGPRQGEAPGPSLKVLFTKDTAHCLQGRPHDVIRIYPPWQKLIIPNGSCPVILNTYFCQKVVAKDDAQRTRDVHGWDTALPKRNISLAWMFRLRSLPNNSPESQVGQVMCRSPAPVRTDWTHRQEAEQHLSSPAPLRDSLLDTAESQGASTWSGVGVPVVVQRAYALPSRCQQGGGPAVAVGSGAPAVRVCLLVQDAYGTFGEVRLEGPFSKPRQLEGTACRLAGVKVLQKGTRGSFSQYLQLDVLFPEIQQRAWEVFGSAHICKAPSAGLFSLIDTLWPPVMPLKAPDHRQACAEVNAHLLPPSFCYILTAHPNLAQIDVIEEDPISKLYQPPVPHFLREILQTDELGTCCSFYARVIHRRALQREIWLTVTDVTLQVQDDDSAGLPKTWPVCVTPSCVLGREVLEALSKAASCTLFFRDALRDQGRILCVERTVLSLPKPILEVASSVCSCELTGPVTLDKLSSVTHVNSICSVQGTVVGVDESTAFSWPTCDLCGNERLERSPDDSGRGALTCADCSRVVTSPLLRRHLQVFLDGPWRPTCTVKVKLAQSSISSLLRSAAGEDGSYEVTSVIGKEVGLSCLVRSVTTRPVSCVGLEEIELLCTERAS